MPDPTFTPPPTAPSRSDAPATFVTRADAFVAWFATLYDELVVFVAWVSTTIAEISSYVQGAGFTGTSTTSLAIGTGTKSLTVQLNLSYVVGSVLKLADTANPGTNFMVGSVTSYNSATGALVVSVPTGSTRGSGTFTAWTVSLSGPFGADGSDASVTFATGAQLRALTADNVVVSPDTVADAMAYVALTDASTVAIDLSAGTNFTLLTTSGVGTGRTLGAPTNGKPGQTFTIEITTDAANRTLAYNTAFKFPGGTVPAITTTSGRKDRLVGQINAAGGVDAQLIKDVR